MADRIALAIEPDTDTANQIRRLLEPKGFKVETISNGDDAMEWGRTNKPAVIILSVEPRKVGYAISNKLRRSPSLREVPLVLISSEETLATFEQHKKLKSRADEYLLKPLEESVFVSKVAGLVGIGHGDDEVHELDADSDIVLSEDDEDVIVDGGDDEERTLLVGDGVVRRRHVGAARAGHGPDAVRGREVRSRDPGGVRGAGGGRGRRVVAEQRHGRPAQPLVRRRPAAEPGLGAGPGQGRQATKSGEEDPDSYRTGETLGPEVVEPSASAVPAPVPVLGEEVPPAPEEIEFGDVATDAARRGGAGGRLRGRAAREGGRGAQLRAGGAHPLARERAPDAAQGDRGGARALHAVRDLLQGARVPRACARSSTRRKRTSSICATPSTRRIGRSSITRTSSGSWIAARRDLEESSLGFERNLVAANERVAELAQDSQKSVGAREGVQGAARRRARGAAQGARGDRRAQEAHGAGGRARARRERAPARRRRVAAGRGRGDPPRPRWPS